MHRYITLLVMLIVLAVVATVTETNRIKVEHFELPPAKLSSNDLTINYTDDIYPCWLPGIFYISDDPQYKKDAYVIDYSFDVQWYKKLLDYHQTMKGANFNPTETEGIIMQRLKEIIMEYDKFPFGPGTCKITVPNWKSLYTIPENVQDTDLVLFGDIKRNIDRKSPDSWAFIAHQNPNIPLLDSKDISFAKYDNNGDSFYKINVDGVEMTRASLNNFEGSTAKKLYCSEIRESNEDYIAFGLKINPFTRQVAFIKENKPLTIGEISRLTVWEVVKFFAPFFPKESLNYENGNENVYKAPIPLTKPVTRITKSICGALKKKDTPSTITVTFTENAGVKSIPTNMTDGKYFFGVKKTVEENMKELDSIISRLNYDMDDKANRWKAAQEALTDAQNDLEKYKGHYGYATWKIKYAFKDDVNNAVNRYRNREISWRQLIREVRDLIKDNAEWKKRQAQYKLDVESKTRKLTEKTNESNTIEELYFAVKSEFEHHQRIRSQVQYIIEAMTDDFIKNVTRMVAWGKLVVIDDPNAKVEATPDNKSIIFPEMYWRYLSYDGNLYVELN